MKKLLITVVCLVFGLSAYCQSLSVKDIEKLTRASGVKQLLASKSFTVIGLDDGAFSTYVKNEKTRLEEKIYLAESTATYSTKNKAYIASLLKQAQSAFHLAVTDENPNYKFYRFDDNGSHISINIPRAANLPGTVTARSK